MKSSKSEENQYSILLIDDNPLNIKALEGILKKQNYNPLIAMNGKQALNLIKEKHLDLILLDIMMPDIDGLKVCEEIKKSSSTKDIPIIFITALNDLPTKLNAFNLGAVDYITKPIIYEEVVARIKVHLQLKQTIDDLKTVSITDDLTGVYNRRFAYEVLGKQIEIVKREESKIAICFIDIDNLKNVNDNHGHEEGDRLITTVINELKNIIRKTDYIFRMGGDEFLILFPNPEISHYLQLIERLQKKINKIKIGKYPVDFSYGFSEYSYQDTLDVEEIIKHSDIAMYKDKKEKKINQK